MTHFRTSLCDLPGKDIFDTAAAQRRAPCWIGSRRG